MTNIKHFTDLGIWRRSHELFLQLLGAVDDFPNTKGGKNRF